MTTATALAELRRARPETLEGTALHVRRQAQQLRSLAAAVRAPHSWRGTAAAAAAEGCRRSAAHQVAVADAVDAAGAALHQLGCATAAAQRLVAQAEALARARGLVVRADGRVVGTTQGPPETGSEALLVQCLVDRAATVYREATAAATVTLQRPLPAVTLTSGAVVPTQGCGIPDGVAFSAAAHPPTFPLALLPWPRPMLDPAAWFAGLDDAARRRLVTGNPEWVAATPGLPAWAHDRANRVLLERAEPRLVAELAAAEARERARPGRGVLLSFGPYDPTVADARGRLDAVRAVRQLLARDDGRARQLLSLDVTGRLVTAAVSTGDVDAAGHVAVFVPGFTTSVQANLAGYAAEVEAATDLATRLSAVHGDGRAVVGVVWQGYEAPQLDTAIVPSRSVLGIGPAQVGAERLAVFVAGLAAAAQSRGSTPAVPTVPVPAPVPTVPAVPVSPEAPATGNSRTAPNVPTHRSPESPSGTAPPRVVVWGHSYGSLVTGVALRDNGLEVSDAVVVGSPGLGVTRIEQLRHPRGAVWVAEAPGDVVADTGWFGTDPSRLTGARVLDLDARVLADGSNGTLARGHVSYLAPGSTSQWSLAAIAAGVPGLVSTR